MAFNVSNENRSRIFIVVKVTFKFGYYKIYMIKISKFKIQSMSVDILNSISATEIPILYTI
jgi:hypothetical protein